MTWVEKIGLVIMLFSLSLLVAFSGHWGYPVFVIVASVGAAIFLVAGKGD